MSNFSAIARLAAGAATLWILSASSAIAATPPRVAIKYQLLTEFAGAETASGRIVVTVSNVSGSPLTDVTLRLANPDHGRLTGEIQQDLQLAPGETRTLSGEFVLPIDELAATGPIEWLVVYSDSRGFAQQALVRSDVPVEATMDADAPRAAPSAQ